MSTSAVTTKNPPAPAPPRGLASMPRVSDDGSRGYPQALSIAVVAHLQHALGEAETP